MFTLFEGSSGKSFNDLEPLRKLRRREPHNLMFFLAVFSLGFVTAVLILTTLNVHSSYSLIEHPESLNPFVHYNGSPVITGNFALKTPFDRIKEDKIKILSDRIIIFIDKPQLAYFAPTGSMKPVLNEKSNAIEVVPKSEQDLHVGDIASYKSRESDDIIIHRIIKISYDSKGWYCIFKGDNNDKPDNERVRFSQIQRVVVGILY